MCSFQLEREKANCAALESTSERLSGENLRLEEQCRAQAEVISRLQAAADEKERMSDELYSMREQLAASKQTSTVMLRGAMEEFHLERLSLEKDLERLRAERDELHQTNVTLMGELKSTQNELSTMRLTLTQKSDEASRVVDAANRSRKQLREELGFKIEQLSTSHARVEAELRETENRLQRELTAARAECEDLGAAKNRTEQELNEVRLNFLYLLSFS